MQLEIDRDYLLALLTDMVRINSVNPSLVPGAPGEGEMGDYVARALEELGLAVSTYEPAPDRVNVIGTLRGAGGGRTLLLNAHMDTVGVEGMTIDPFGAEVRDGRVYGRGTQDMKASLAAMLAATKAILDAGAELAGDLLITAVADEEYTSIGMEDLVQRVQADAAIVTEPTDLVLCRAHRGFIWYDVETYGRAAHGSRYTEGVDANMRMGWFLARLDLLERELRRRPAHPLVGTPSLHAALLRGGSEISVYADHCLLQLERRTVPGETEAQATEELKALVTSLARADDSFRASVKPTFKREPLETPADAAIVQTLDHAMEERLGERRAHAGQTYWTDAALLAETGIPSVLLGPVGAGLHSAEEWVEIESVVTLAEILATTACDFCGSGVAI